MTTNKKQPEPDFVVRQRAEAKAKLDALLETVKVTRRNSYDRPPRKVGEIFVDTGLKDGHRDQKARFVLRLDARSGLFSVEHGEMVYTAKTREALQAKMDEVGRITLDLAWTRYIHIEYAAETDRTIGYNSHRIDVDEKRTKKTRVYGISLRWQIVDYTEEFTIPGQEPRRMKRDVSDDGIPSGSQDTVSGIDGNPVLYTPERLAILRSISDTLTAVDARMIGLFRGKASRVAAQLDAVARTGVYVEDKFMLTAGIPGTSERDDEDEDELRVDE
jgi:hypothetical protein